jgi:hypothetical protein
LGGVQVDFIHLVKTPRLRFQDQPYSEDENMFEENLAHALQTQIYAAYRRPEIDLSPIQDKIASYSWTGAFRKVQDIYFRVMKNINDSPMED